MNNEHDTIKLEGIDLYLDESKSIHCPYCDAGDHAPSMGITRVDDGIVFNCFRASCGAKGFIPSIGNTPTKTNKKSNIKPIPQELNNLTQLPYHIINKLYEKYELNKNDLVYNDVVYSEELNRIVFRLYDIYHNLIGYHSRSLIHKQPKTYPLKKPLPLVMYRKIFFTTQKVVLVEDPFSAIKVANYIPTICLLGTNLSINHIGELLKYNIKELIIWLDFDAVHKSIMYKRMFGGIFDIGIIMTAKDPKDTPHSEIEDLLHEH